MKPMPSEDELSELLSSSGLEVFDYATRLRIDELLAKGLSVEPVSREKLVLAAQRGLRVPRSMQDPFELLAFDTRIADDIDVERVAEVIGASVDLVREIEQGKSRIIDHKPKQIAKWINLLEIDHTVGVEAVRRSLAVSAARTVVAYASRESEPVLTEQSETFLTKLEAELAKLRRS
jgi:hypothetical protein